MRLVKLITLFCLGSQLLLAQGLAMYDPILGKLRSDLARTVAGSTSFSFASATELTIAGGVVTATQSSHKLQPQTGTDDDLDTINGLSDGQIAVFYVADAGTDTITFKHGTGNIECPGGADIELSYGCVTCYSDGTTVYASGGGGGGGGGGGTVQGTDGTYDIQATNEGATAGNARGENSVDLQTERAAASQIASGANSVIAGGENNTASIAHAFVGGGESNTASTATHATVVGGKDNLVSVQYGFIGGGQDNLVRNNTWAAIVGGYDNESSGQYSLVGGGKSNTANTSYSFVGGGESNTASTGTHAAVAGGKSNTASGAYATVPGGLSCQATGNFGFATNGYTEATAQYSSAFGSRSKATHHSEIAFASGQRAAAGDNQWSICQYLGTTTDATPTELKLDNSTHYFTIASGDAYRFKLAVFGVKSSDMSEYVDLEIVGKIANIGGTTAIVGTNVTTVFDRSTATLTCTATADDGNSRLAVTPTGKAATTMYWNVKAEFQKIGL